MRIKRLELAGFRGFADLEEFDLDADAVVVSGANGRGKTSFFDAMLWGLTGELPRIGAPADVVSLYSRTGEARVDLIIGSDNRDSDVRIARSTDGELHRVQIEGPDNLTASGEAAEVEIRRLLWPTTLHSTDAEQTVAKTFTRSVYLEQDLLRQYLETDSDDERFQVLSEVVGVGRVTELQQHLARAKRGWTRGTTQVESEVREWTERVEELHAEIERLGSAEVDDQSMQDWADWWDEVNEEVDAEIPETLDVRAKSRLEDTLETLEDRRTEVERRLSRLRRVQESIESLPAAGEPGPVSLGDQIEELEEALAAAREALSAAEAAAEMRRANLVKRKERAGDLAAMAELALRHLDEHCPVCTQTHDMEHTRRHLLDLIDQTEAGGGADTEQPDQVEVASEEVERLVSELETLRKRERELQQAKQEWTEHVDEVRRQLDLLGRDVGTDFDSETIEEWVTVETKSAEQVAAQYAELVSRGESLSLTIARLREGSKKLAIEENLQEATAKLKESTSKLERRNTTGDLCDQIIASLREGEHRIVQQEIKRLEPLLKSVYAKIDPHPAFVDVAFAVSMYYGKGRLSPEIKDPYLKESVSEPGKVLSSSQLNALAVAVFLALNLGTSDLPLSTMLLDDPLQSLDDVNLLGLVDLLRRVRPQRQVFVSTHDEALARLLTRKLRPVDQSQRTIHVEFTGWSRRGPKVDAYEVKRETDVLRVVA